MLVESTLANVQYTLPLMKWFRPYGNGFWKSLEMQKEVKEEENEAMTWKWKWKMVLLDGAVHTEQINANLGEGNIYF